LKKLKRISKMIKHTKPNLFYDEFTRNGKRQKTTHYCPGCGHGNAHKLLAEVIDELEIQDRVVLCSPVGCSVFLYNYFDTGNVQGAHGRNPAIATGIARTHENAVVISYQGDGDLASIGIGPIVHAANRGENMTVIFVNNAVYGMTGGQMAPTSLIGQKTRTTPDGRCEETDGAPIAMSEMLSTLKGPVFVERVTLSSAVNTIKAKKVFKKALTNQVNRKGFSFVEVLSPCPVNWKMTPVEAREWMKSTLEKQFPVKNFKDIERPAKTPGKAPINDSELLSLLGVDVKTDSTGPNTEKKIVEQEIKIAGFGGQGVMSVGVLLANSAVNENLYSTWLPSYGPEMRGGTANASVIVSSKMIGSPLVDRPNVLIALNAPSLDSFEDSVMPGGMIIINSSLVNRKVKRKDVYAYYVPATEIAKDIGLDATVGVVMLTVYSLISGCIEPDTIKDVLPKVIKKQDLISCNLKAIEAGASYYNRMQIGQKTFQAKRLNMLYRKTAKVSSFL
jgi:2-oxoisovalerate ferredoxin oxidoreductase beta subunit